MQEPLRPAHAPMTCPKCGGTMSSQERNGVVIDRCHECRGVFLDRGELERLIDLEQANAPGWGGGQVAGNGPASGGYPGGGPIAGGYPARDPRVPPYDRPRDDDDRPRYDDGRRYRRDDDDDDRYDDDRDRRRRRGGFLGEIFDF